MLDLTVRFKAACPRHPRFRPQQGWEAIRGGCPHCERLLVAFGKIIKARNEVNEELEGLRAKKE